LTASAEQLAGAVAAVIGDAMHRVRVMSFDWRGLRWLRSAHPQIGLAWLTGALPATGDVPAAVAAEGGPVWVPEHSSITPQILREAHRLGLRVIPWTVKAPADMHRLQAWGVDGLITDRPDLFVPAQSDKTDLSTDHAIVRKFEVTAARDSSA
jgi:glycerophosphoryl diester phosphodiesterase